MSQAQTVRDILQERKEELLAQAFDRLEEDGERPRQVTAEAAVEVDGLTLQVRVVLDAERGDVVSYEELPPTAGT
jgi:hypothetical protein